jgi:hypothetical protein
MDRTQSPTGVVDGLLKAAECMDTERLPRSTKVEVGLVVIVIVIVAEMPSVPVTCRKMQYLPRTGRSVHPLQFRWTPDTDDGMIALYLLGLPMESIANKLVYGFTRKQAQDWICNRLKVLKLRKEIPEKWQRVYHQSPESTTTERYTLEEDIELLQWRANGRLVINAQIFVEGNRSAAGMYRRADSLCGLPGLLENVVRIEEEVWEKQKAAEVHFARYRLCGHCDHRAEVWDWLMDDMEEGYQ